MFSRFRLLTCVFAVLALSGCVSTEVPAASTQAAKTIGLVYALPNTIQFARAGVLVFGNGHSEGDISAWNLPEVFLSQAKQTLSARYRVTVRSVPDKTFADLPNVLSPLSGFQFTGALRTALGPNPPHADIWVVLRPTCLTRGNYRGPLPCGVGIYRPNDFFSTPAPWAVIMADATVFDGNSLEAVAQADIRQASDNCLASDNMIAGLLNPGCPPETPLSEDFRVDSWNQYQPAQLATLKAEYTRMLQGSVDPTLRRLKLIQ